MGQPRKHANIPIFIPHLGCPNACVFCDQRTISGHRAYDPEAVRREIEEVLGTLGECEHREIAFFGGSFTGIDRTQMLELLELAQSYVRRGAVDSIRLSTRPDYIDEEILTLLSRYAVRTVELGLQSMDDRVLAASRRGHDSQTAANACALIKAHGFDLVGQMMIGLPHSDGPSERMTAERIVELGADAARVYPTVVFRTTELGRMTEQGIYQPLTESETVCRTADVLEIFDRAAIPVIRVGLCASENLSSDEAVLAGANGSAVGEQAMGEVFYRRMKACLTDAPRGCEAIFRVPMGAASRAAGHRRYNSLRLCREYGLKRIRIYEDETLRGYQIQFECNISDKNA